MSGLRLGDTSDSLEAAPSEALAFSFMFALLSQNVLGCSCDRSALGPNLPKPCWEFRDLVAKLLQREQTDQHIESLVCVYALLMLLNVLSLGIWLLVRTYPFTLQLLDAGLHIRCIHQRLLQPEWLQRVVATLHYIAAGSFFSCGAPHHHFRSCAFPRSEGIEVHI